MTTNRAALYAKIYKVLKKHYKPVTPLAERPILDHLLYACCLENARYEMADEAFAKLQFYADWNEVRVTTVTEMSEVMTMLPDALDAARRVKQTLQSVFETRYSFDLDYLKKMNLGKAVKELEEIKGASPYVVAYVSQHGLGGHTIPANRGVFEAFVAIGVITANEAASGRIPGMERAVAKSKGVEFASLLHQFGVDFQTTSQSAKMKAMLQEVNPHAEMPKKRDETAGSRRPSGSKRRKPVDGEEKKKASLKNESTPPPAKAAKAEKSKSTAKATSKPITKKKPK